MKLKKKIKDDFDTQVGMPTRLGTMSGVMEDGVPANNAGGGAVAGIGVGLKGEPGVKSAPLLRRHKFAGMHIFEVDSDTYHRCKMGKKKYHRYDKYVGKDEIGEAIRQFGRHWKTQHEPILIQDRSTGHFQFLKYGKKNHGI